jgi:uncharacterized membrane protein
MEQTALPGITEQFVVGLESLVAAELIRTETLAPTFTNIGVLAAVILAPAFLS